MKKLCIIILALLVVSNIFGQTNIDLKFTGVYNTNWVQLDSIKIENLTQNGDTMLYYPDTTLSFTIIGQSENLTKNIEFRLYQNYPNPVSDNTTIKLYIPEKDKVVIKITDLLGRLSVLHEQILEHGYHSFIFTPGIANIYVVSASWRGNTRNIKVINQGNSDGNSPCLSYSAKNGSNRYLKSLQSSKGINFTVGDSLKFTGYYDTLENVIEDTFGVSTNYTFHFVYCPSSFIDFRDSNVYQAVQIGNQCWMAENLAYLPSVNNSVSLTFPYYYVYGYAGANVTVAKTTYNYQTYGALYNWSATMDGSLSSNSVPSGVQGACPLGWHLPSDTEWDIIVNYLGGWIVAGGKMKETGFTHWNSPNTGSTNVSGFSALSGGCLFYYGGFVSMGDLASFWSSTESNSDNTWRRILAYDSESIYRSSYNKKYGFSVRCLRD